MELFMMIQLSSPTIAYSSRSTKGTAIRYVNCLMTNLTAPIMEFTLKYIDGLVSKNNTLLNLNESGFIYNSYTYPGTSNTNIKLDNSLKPDMVKYAEMINDINKKITYTRSALLLIANYPNKWKLVYPDEWKSDELKLVEETMPSYLNPFIDNRKYPFKHFDEKYIPMMERVKKNVMYFQTFKLLV